MKNLSPQQLWHSFEQAHALTSKQLKQFQKYYKLLVETNDIHNLTAITHLERVLDDHFNDSLALEKFIDCSKLESLCDVGTGAGFPALPLKIKYPSIEMIVIEVNRKKINFLNYVIQELGLENIWVYDLDWRTFLRKTDYEVELFCTRASLQITELFRMFKPASPYRDKQLVYWASKAWEPTEKETPFVQNIEWYTLGNKKRKLIFFSRPNDLV